MKKLIILIIIIILQFGCAGAEKIRTVQDENIFYSTNTPKIRIKINPDFKFEKETKDQETDTSIGFGDKMSNQKSDRFLFIDRVSKKPRGVQIMIVEMDSPRWSFKAKIFASENEFDSGRIKIQGNSYQYSTFVVKYPNYYLLIRGIGRLVGANDNAIIYIYYFEQVTGDWSNFNTLTSEQKKQLDEFIKDSEKDIQILEYKAPTSTPSEGKWDALSFTRHRG